MSVAQASTAIELNEHDLDAVVGGLCKSQYPTVSRISININIQEIIQIGNGNIAIQQAGKNNQVNGNNFIGKKR